jgi:transcriptional regulator with XRE-family HTH domain
VLEEFSLISYFFNMELNEMLKMSRQIKGYSIRQLEKQSGISNALISQIETGKVQNPGFFTVMALAHSLGITKVVLSAERIDAST